MRGRERERHLHGREHFVMLFGMRGEEECLCLPGYGIMTLSFFGGNKVDCSKRQIGKSANDRSRSLYCEGILSANFVLPMMRISASVVRIVRLNLKGTKSRIDIKLEESVVRTMRLHDVVDLLRESFVSARRFTTSFPGYGHTTKS